jgi:hypothetical protein
MGLEDLDKIQSEWDPNGVIAGIKAEHDVFNESPLEMARKHLETNSVVAAQTLVWLALHGDDKTRLAAAKEILTRTLGAAAEQASHGQSPLEALLKTVHGRN